VCDVTAVTMDFRRRLQLTCQCPLMVPARLRRTGLETRLLIDGAGGGPRRTPDHSLCRLLAQAYRYNALVMRGGGKTMAELAAEAGVTSSWFTRILRLSFLAPEVVKAILRDRHPIELTAKRLAKDSRLPTAWDEQHALFGNRQTEGSTTGPHRLPMLRSLGHQSSKPGK